MAMALRERSFVRMSAILAISLQSGAGSGAVSISGDQAPLMDIGAVNATEE